ncbi:MAG TPA: DUF3865 domain-containing protein [Blastocatellia bacterium]|jgi:hypothetical protein|nr:DUF3865 domain-containing protein [Blastocatellia bacterium]
MINQAATATSDHLAIANLISAFNKKHPETYAECVDTLLEMLRTHFPSLTHETNPVMTNLDAWNADDLAFLLVEYSGWLNETIHIFLEARIRIYWESVRKEIERNVGEEMGDLTAGVPHLELMRQGYFKDLGVETDNADHSLITKDFINKMRQVFKHKDNAFLAGALLGFEAVATEEFKVANTFLRRRKTLLGSEIGTGSLTGIYIAGHVSAEGEGVHPEDLHSEGMRQSIEPHINAQNIHKFIKGFFSTCLNINIWWERLAVEIFHQKVNREELTVTDAEIVDIDGLLKRKSAHS